MENVTFVEEKNIVPNHVRRVRIEENMKCGVQCQEQFLGGWESERMSMTENEKKATFEDAIYCAKALAGEEVCEECRLYPLCHTFCDDVYRIILDSLKEIQAYRAIGTVDEFKALKDHMWAINEVCKDYSALGSIEECRAAVEKIKPKKAIPDKPLEKGSFIKWHCPNCGELRWRGFYYPPLTFDKVCTNCLQAIDWN